MIYEANVWLVAGPQPGGARQGNPDTQESVTESRLVNCCYKSRVQEKEKWKWCKPRSRSGDFQWSEKEGTFFLKGMWGGGAWVGKRKGILNGILFPELYQLANNSYKRNKDREKEFHALKSPQSAANAPGFSYQPFIPTAPSPSLAITSVQVHPGGYCHADETRFSHCPGRHSHQGLALLLIQAGLNCPGE